MKSFFSSILVLLAFASGIVNAQWVQTNGPEGARVRAIYSEGSNLFIGTSVSGVFVSTNHGASWSSRGLTSYTVLSLTSDGTFLYAGTEQGGVFRSSDYGVNWQQVNTGLTSTNVGTIYVLGTDVFAGTTLGVFRSTNAGSSWTNSSLGLGSVPVAIIVANGSTLFAGTHSNGVYRSTNGGSDWNSVTSGLPTSNILSLHHDGIYLFAATDGNGIYRSTNDGSTWNAANVGVDSRARCIVRTYTSLVAGGYGLFRSTDDGSTWVSIDAGITDRQTQCLIYDGMWERTSAGMNGGGVYSSNDDGLTWTATNTQLYAASVFALVAAHDSLFAVAIGSGVHLTTDGGTSWSSRNNGLSSTRVVSLFDNGALLMAGTEDAGIFRSFDRGASWTSTSGSDFGYIWGVSAYGSDFYAASYFGGVLRSTDEGASWTQRNNGLPVSTAAFYRVASVESNLFAAGSEGIYRSSDEGANWTQKNTGLTNIWVCDLVVQGSVIFAATLEGVFRSTNLGDTWVLAAGGFAVPEVQRLGNIVAACGPVVRLSRSQGFNWTSVTGPPYDVQTIAATGTFLFVGTGRYLWGEFGGGMGVWRRPTSEVLFSVSGNVFNDRNGNSIRDNGEGGIPDWQVHTSIGLAPMIDTVLTDANGDYIITELPMATTYTIRQQTIPMWKATFPAGAGTYSAYFSEGGENDTGKNFASFEISSISGNIFNDLNGNTVKDITDTGLVGWKIRLARDGTPVESTLTNSSGDYLLTNLPIGNYAVNQEIQPEWYQTLPTLFRPYYDTIVTGGTLLPGRNFGDVYHFVFGNTSGGSWSDTANWPGSMAPNPTTPVIIPTGVTVTVDKLPYDSIQSLQLAGNGFLRFSDSVGILRIARDLTIDTAATLQFPHTSDTTGLICYGSIVNSGYFDGGRSTVRLAGSGTKVINSSESKPDGRTNFYRLEISDTSAGMIGNIGITDRLILQSNLDPRDQDTIRIDTSAVDAIQGSGIVPRGTISRRIAQGETNPYRFESPQTYLQFDGSGTYPSSVSMRVLPDTVAPSFSLNWEVVGGVVDTGANVLVRDSTREFSKWAIGIPRPLGVEGIVGVGREYSIQTTEGTGFSSQLSLRYDPNELFEGVAEEELIMLRGPWVHDTTIPRWNMLSVPVVPDSSAKEILFAGSTSDAFAFDGSYAPRSHLEDGRGYWLKFDTATHVAMKGDDIGKIGISLVEGWNLIGSISYPVLVGTSVSTEPSGILTSSFYGYDNGYRRVDTLLPMHAYWVKAGSPGTVLLTRTEPSAFGASPKEYTDGGPASLTFSDASGSTQVLSFNASTRQHQGLENDEMPPVPPARVFDARYATGTIMEYGDGKTVRSVPVVVSHAVYPIDIQWAVPDAQRGRASLQIGTEEIQLQSNGVRRVDDPSVLIELVLQPHDGRYPTTFALQQNYPNPFNSQTMIHYDVPRRAHISIQLYNILGQPVMTLVDGMQDVGYHTVSVDGQGLSTGVYVYRLTVGELSQSRKLLLMK